VPSLVAKEDLLSAITLNSTQFNMARAVGPAIGGLLVATVGAGAAFLVNSLTFSAVIGSLLLIPSRGRPPSTDTHHGLLAQLGTTLRYIRGERGIMTAIAVAMLVAALGNPVQTFTTVFADEVYDVGAAGYGVLAMALGVGAIIGAPFLSGWGELMSRGRLVAGSLVVYGLAVMAFGQSRLYVIGVIALALCGFSFLAVVASTNTATQLIVGDERRGRVMAVRISGFTLAFPVGAFVQGLVSDVIGPELTITIAGTILLLVALRLWFAPAILGSLDVSIDE
jgi:predicted MFS family arabinose efflux permease